MENEISPIGSAGSTELPQRQTFELDALTEKTAIAETQSSNFSKLAREALGSALSNPDDLSPNDSIRAGITSPTGGAVGNEKSEIVSEIDRPGAENSSAQNSEDVHDQIIDRSRVLYTDLTVYNVAWSVAMRVQKDVSQLLRGS